jgi:hypothetical protein
VQLAYSLELEKNSRQLIEFIESQLVQMLIQRETLASFEQQQEMIDDIWSNIIVWIESALQHSCKRRKPQNVKDIFWTPDLKKQKEQRKTNKSYVFYKRYCKNLQKRKQELYLELIQDKSAASKRGDLFRLIKSSNRKRTTCFLNPMQMSEHANHFLKTLGGNPQGAH